ncbi:MAG: phosphatidate cytidylyltransferase [Deltaproteobacteria bacterium]|nr:phosphatidate cytidylyltransferase [Deltaproteobacteria bacterium]
MHLKRLLTACVALPLFVLLIYRGSHFLFAVFVAVVSLLALREYYQMVQRMIDSPVKGWMSIIGYLSAMTIAASAYFDSPQPVLSIIVVSMIASVLISLTQVEYEVNILLDVLLRQLLGVVYVPGLLSFLIFIRCATDGAWWLFFLFSVVFVGDAAAYYIGSFFGKRKLSPLISPGKTVEGSIAGLCAGIAAGLLCKYILNLSISFELCGLLSILIVVAAQIGDLFESLLKRSANLKDSGTIIPGHGGVLDRIDATLFAAPVLYAFKELVL